MAAMPDEAVAAARLVQEDDTSTYLDRVLAGLAAASALMPRDPEAGVERLDQAHRTASVAGDAAAIALASAVRAEIGPESEKRAVPHLGDGWKRVVKGLGSSCNQIDSTS